jgi:hypothetical protein
VRVSWAGSGRGLGWLQRKEKEETAHRTWLLFAF